MAALLAASVWLSVVRDGRFVLQASPDDSLYLTPRAASLVALSYKPLAADLYWIRAIQLYGGTLHEIRRQAELGRPPSSPPPSSLDYHLLYPLLDIATTLDPRFNIAYRFGAIFLSERYPTGAGRPDQAVALLEKGFRQVPERWEYLEDIGFVYYWDLHDYQTAARYFDRAADLPGAPWWLRSLAATMLARGGERSASRLLWGQIYQSSEDPRARDAARLKLLQLDALEQIERLQQIVDAFGAKTERRELTWAVLVRAGVLSGIPLDPNGTPYDLSSSGVVALSPESPLWPLPIEPAPHKPS
jgi:hypothetical protein